MSGQEERERMWRKREEWRELEIEVPYLNIEQESN